MLIEYDEMKPLKPTTEDETDTGSQGSEVGVGVALVMVTGYIIPPRALFAMSAIPPVSNPLMTAPDQQMRQIEEEV